MKTCRLFTVCVMAGMLLLPGALVAETPATPKPAPEERGAGCVAWFDITTGDLAKSREFYGKLFGWEFVALTGTDMAVEIVSRGTPIGTLRVAEGAISPFNGVVYVQVDDVQASCEQAKALGAMVPPGFPFNLVDRVGAIGVVVDPSGHPVGMYSRTPIAPPTPGK